MWPGLYLLQKKANVTGNETKVQTAMIYGALWDRTMQFIRKQNSVGKTTYNVDEENKNWHDKHNNSNILSKSGQANPGKTGDVALNIWDLEANGSEVTQEASGDQYRVIRGGHFRAGGCASSSSADRPYGGDSSLDTGSRLVLWIK